MKLARVVGTVVSTICDATYEHRKLLWCALLDADGKPQSGYLIAIDTVGAGAGEMVLILDEGGSARQVLQNDKAAARTVIVGIVDDVQITS
jgi:ethanolamine utilization protein EutN